MNGFIRTGREFRSLGVCFGQIGVLVGHGTGWNHGSRRMILSKD